MLKLALFSDFLVTAEQNSIKQIILVVLAWNFVKRWYCWNLHYLWLLNDEEAIKIVNL